MSALPSGFQLKVTPFSRDAFLAHQVQLATLSLGAAEARVATFELALRPTRWVGDKELLATLGLQPYTVANPNELIALALGKHPRTGVPLTSPAETVSYLEFVITAPASIAAAYQVGDRESKLVVIAYMEATADRLIRNYLLDTPFPREVAYALATDLHLGGPSSKDPGLHIHACLFNLARPLAVSV